MTFQHLGQRLPIFHGIDAHAAASWTNAAGDGWEDWGGTSPLTLTVSKIYGSGLSNLLVTSAYTVWLTIDGNCTWDAAVYDGTSRFGTITNNVNVAGYSHHAMHRALVTGRAAGSVTLKLQIDNTTGGSGIVNSDGNQPGWMQVWEVPT